MAYMENMIFIYFILNTSNIILKIQIINNYKKFENLYLNSNRKMRKIHSDKEIPLVN